MVTVKRQHAVRTSAARTQGADVRVPDTDAPRRRRVSAALAWLLAAVAIAGLLVCWCVPPRFEGVFPLPQLAAIGPWYALPAAAACAMGTWSRRWLPLAAAIACLAVQAAVALPYFVPSATTPSQRDASVGAAATDPAASGSLRVMTLNAYHGQANAAAIVEAVREQGVDVLCLQETTAALVDALERAGLADLLPHRVGPTVGSQIWSRLPLADEVNDAVGYEGSAMPAATIAPDGLSVRVVSVHTCSPTPGYERLWARSLGLLAEVGSSDEGAPADGTPYLLAGDFNASLYHASFRAILEAGFSDGARAAGEGLAFTWPADGPLPPLVTLDHMLLGTGLAATDFGYLDIPGTDHLAVLATVRRAG